MNNITPLKKIEWVNLPKNKMAKKFKDFSIKHDMLGDLRLSLKEPSSDTILIELKNKENNLLGKEELTIDPRNKYMFGQSIEVNSFYRKSGLRLGEILRACSVMFMNENNMNLFEIFSKNTAIFFHSKFKFKPFENSLVFNKRMLDSIINDSKANIESLQKKAKDLKDKIVDIQEFTDTEAKICSDTNNLTDDFLQKALKEDKNPEIKHSFISGFSMALTKDNVNQNKEFFNNIFKKYNIDYKI